MCMKCKYCSKEIPVKSACMVHEKHCPCNQNRINTMPDSGEYHCQYCGKICKRPGTLKLHEQSCHSNPNRVQIKHNYCNFHSERLARPEGWKCPFCDSIFMSKNKLYAHRHAEHPDTIKSKNRDSVCPYCNEKYTGKKRDHYKLCTKKPHGPHKWTNEERAHLAEVKRQFAKEHPEKCNWKSTDKFVSPPCETLKTILADNKFKFESEYTDASWSHAYSLDIAFIDIKLDIEVNGNQHYYGGQLKPYYQERHDYLVSQGWEVIELHFKDCYRPNKIEELLTLLRSKISPTG